MTEMTYSRFERTDVDYKADTFGLWPGVAGVQIEHKAERYCPTCGKDIIGEELFDELREDNVESPEFGVISVLLSGSGSTLQEAHCGHCGIELDV